MDYLDILLSKEYSYNCKITNQFNTTITISKAGVESRLRNWVNYLKKYDITYSVKTDEQINHLRDFFNTTSGSYYGFKFFDYTDGILNLKNAYTKYIGKNYLRIYRKVGFPISYNGKMEQLERKIDAWHENDITIDDFTKSELIEKIDYNLGRIYIKPTKTIEVTIKDNKIVTNIDELKESNTGLIYINDKEYKIINFENDGITFFSDTKMNGTYTVKQYSADNIPKLSSNKEIEFYHIVRFESDNFDITINDFNINTTTLTLVELKTED